MVFHFWVSTRVRTSKVALAVFLTREEIEEVESAYKFDHGFPHTLLSGILFKAEDKPKQANEPGDMWLMKAQSRNQPFDWMEDFKAIRPPQ